MVFNLTMNSNYIRSICQRLHLASLNVAKKNKTRYYPLVKKDMSLMTDKEVDVAIKSMIIFLQTPEHNHQHYVPKITN